MRRALALAASPGVPTGPNPRVGCVLLDAGGRTVAEGWHRGAGSPHAEVDALRQAGDVARGATAVVTLEPCNHTGRTGPCARALVEAGVRRVVFAQRDPNPVAAGGAATLRAAGVEVEGGLLEDEARQVNREWTFAMDHGRPFVTWKFATTLDGRSAAADGTSRWVSSRAARVDTHRLRALCDTMLVGSGTIAVDDPLLTVRDDERPPARRPAAARGDGAARPAGRPPGLRRVRAHRPPAHARPARGAQGALRARPPARLPRGRADAGRGVLAGRARRRGRRVRRPDAARLRARGRRRPGHRHHRRRRAPHVTDVTVLDAARAGRRRQRPPHHDPASRWSRRAVRPVPRPRTTQET